MSWEGTPEEESLEATWENRHRGLEDTDVTCWGRLFQMRADQQGRPDHRRWTAVYDGHSATVRKQIEGVSGP